jgi:hypothetical protein
MVETRASSRAAPLRRGCPVKSRRRFSFVRGSGGAAGDAVAQTRRLEKSPTRRCPALVSQNDSRSARRPSNRPDRVRIWSQRAPQAAPDAHGRAVVAPGRRPRCGNRQPRRVRARLCDGVGEIPNDDRGRHTVVPRLDKDSTGRLWVTYANERFEASAIGERVRLTRSTPRFPPRGSEAARIERRIGRPVRVTERHPLDPKGRSRREVPRKSARRRARRLRGSDEEGFFACGGRLPAGGAAGDHGVRA